MTEAAIVSKVWNFANVLRDDGVGYGDYLEQITYLLFLKMADEFSKPPYNRKPIYRRDSTGKVWPESVGQTWRRIIPHYSGSWARHRAHLGRYLPKHKIKSRTRQSC